MREFHEIQHMGDQGIDQNECCKWWIDQRIGIDVTGDHGGSANNDCIKQSTKGNGG
jgi:hypothetical protein